MRIRDYLAKMKGGATSPPRVGLHEVLWALAGSAIAMCICQYISARYFEPRDLTLIVGSLGASAVLVYGAIKSPFAQPRNLVGGHIVSGLVGVSCYQLFGGTLWLAAALAVSFAIGAMMVTKTVHPPGGATALIAVIGGPKVHALGFLYPFVPAGLGALILLAVALLVNNLATNRKYPEYWF
ncbi:MAG: HPP family protein [Syntrophales bacterium]